MVIHSELAIFWDGAKQLSGILEIFETELTFQFEDFKHSHLGLRISFEEIQYAKEFLLFNLTRNGLKIVSRDGKIDMFILDDSKSICELINFQLAKVS